MSNKRNLSQQSIDTVIKLNIKLRNDLLEQLESFESAKNEYLLIELKKLLEFRYKRRKEETEDKKSSAYLEISICQIEKIVDILCKLDGHSRLKNQSDDLLFKINKIKNEIIDDLIMLPSKLFLEFEINEDNNLNNDNYFSANNEPNYVIIDEPNYVIIDEPNYNEPNYNEPNNNEPNNNELNNNESNYNIIHEHNYNLINEPINEIDQVINKSLNKKPIDESLNNEKPIDESSNDKKPINVSLNNEKPIDKSSNDKVIESLFIFVFQHLSIKDLLNCRLVNKQFKQLSDNSNGIEKLIIGQPYLEDDDYHWYFNNKLIEEKDRINLKFFRSIKLLSIFNLDKNLKYLKIYDQKLELEEISNFTNLESLEFSRYYHHNVQSKNINFNNLKILIAHNQKVKLMTPKLEKIEFLRMETVLFKSNPESIKHLSTKNYRSKFKIFKNLEIMELRNSDSRFIDENLLILFDNLKTFKMNLDLNKFNYSDFTIKNFLTRIFNDRIKLKRNFTIYLEGIKIKKLDTEDFDKINNIITNSCLIWKFRLNYYHALDFNLPFINELKYGQLEYSVDNLKTDLPSSFFDRFSNIYDISVDCVKDVNNLNWFLNNLKYLTKLKIYSKVSINQNLYNNLPNTIRYLIVCNKEDINYDFIFKLSKLIHFSTEIKKDLFELAFKSFSNLKYLNYFQFYFYYYKRVLIEKNDEKFYLNNGRTKLDYEELLEKCNAIRSI